MSLEFLFVCLLATAITFVVIYFKASFVPTLTRGRVKASDWGSYHDRAADPNEASVDLAVPVHK
jgi:hypothetical protein